MAFKLNPYVDEQNHQRCSTSELAYMRQLDARGMLLTIENMLVDAEQLVLRTFQCDSAYCVKCSQQSGAAKYKGSCCTDLEVDVTEEEVRRLQELGRMGKERLQLTASDPLTPVLDRLTKKTFIEPTEKGETAFKHLPSGRCALSWMTPGGILRCGINSLCMALELPLIEYKPDPCYLFPLHYMEPVPNTYFITLLSKETYQYIGADAYVGKLRCLAKPQPGSAPAYQFLRSELNHCFHGGIYDALDAAAQPILQRHGLLAANGPEVAADLDIAGENAELPQPRPAMRVAVG